MQSDVKYIVSMGSLVKKGNSLCLINESGNNYIPIEGIREIYCLNEISINSKLLDFLSKKNIVLHFFNYHQGYSGTFYPKEKYISGKITVEQVRLFDKSRLEIAKSIVLSICKNIHETIYHYYRHGKFETWEYLEKLKDVFPERINAAEDIASLMAVEGSIWEEFYGSFKIFINEDFILNKRVRRPPDNPINALISFGNSWLYTKVINELYQTHLDQSVSFLHAPSTQRFSLALDLAETFKPIIVYKTIFECVNNKRIMVEKHFDKKHNYCLLNEEGRKIFVTQLQSRIDSLFEHSTLKRKVSLQTAIKLDGYKLIKTILEGEEFIPFSIKDKC